jgi:hypothetical protein
MSSELELRVNLIMYLQGRVVQPTAASRPWHVRITVPTRVWDW